jgi:hypothetical protein
MHEIVSTQTAISSTSSNSDHFDLTNASLKIILQVYSKEKEKYYLMFEEDVHGK